MSSLFMDNDICYQGTDDVQVYRLTRALAITIYRELPYTFHKRLGFNRQPKMKHPLNKKTLPSIGNTKYIKYYTKRAQLMNPFAVESPLRIAALAIRMAS